jgi:hypothetical protein
MNDSPRPLIIIIFCKTTYMGRPNLSVAPEGRTSDGATLSAQCEFESDALLPSEETSCKILNISNKFTNDNAKSNDSQNSFPSSLNDAYP